MGSWRLGNAARSIWTFGHEFHTCIEILELELVGAAEAIDMVGTQQDPWVIRCDL